MRNISWVNSTVLLQVTKLNSWSKEKYTSKYIYFEGKIGQKPDKEKEDRKGILLFLYCWDESPFNYRLASLVVLINLK